VRYFRIALVGAGVVVGFFAYRVQIDNLRPLHATTPAHALAIVAIGVAFVSAGAITYSDKYPNRFGLLLVATGFVLLARQFRYSHHAFLFTTFFALGDLGYTMVAHSALAYPTGKLRDRLERGAVIAGYVSVLVFPLLILFFYPGVGGLHELDGTPRRNLLLLSANRHVALRIQDVFAITFDGVLALLFIALMIRRLALATPRGRRILAPLALAAAALSLRAVYESIYTFGQLPPSNMLFWWQVLAFIALPIALVDGLLRARLAHASVGDLMLELEGRPPEELGRPLARALRDQSLEIAFWLPNRNGYVDSAGRPVQVPPPDGRAVTTIENDGEPVAALIHDRSLLDNPTLLDAAAAAARVSLENARLHAEMRAQLEQVRESRARIVTAADEERRRIERDIHDGAQQRLVALGLQLRTAQRRLGPNADPQVTKLVDATVDELQAAVDELRELARGVHPAILTEDGLGAALESLAARTPFPIQLDTFDERLPAPVEAAAYFVASEALANVAKHAAASKACVTARRLNGRVEIVVEDDGVGGAHPEQGSGLRGLADRVEALGGELRIERPAGGGTRIVGEIPCAS
jgi:signal transduction histidine kinase